MNKSSNRREQIDHYLEAIRGGNSEAEDELWQYVYDELHRQAHHLLRHERQGHTLQTTALVHEAYLNLADSPSRNWVNPEHFFNLAARVMRNILVNHARKKYCPKRNPGRRDDEIELDQLPQTNLRQAYTGKMLIQLDEALKRLEQVNKRQAKIVELRFFGGLTNEEIANLINVSEKTVKREWQHAKAWLWREVQR